jgi:uncharacterized RDD family membrane protein YckC
LEFAGAGNRILACLVDTLITYFCIVVLIILCALGYSLDTRLPITLPFVKLILSILMMVCTIIASFVIYFGYFIYFEGTWQGQTPGKKLAGIRVIEQNGQPVSWSAVWIRNLVRIVDEGLMLIGLLVMIFDRHERRLGDLAANTIVIRERTTNLSTSNLKLTASLSSNDTFDTGSISPEEYELLLNFFQRRQNLDQSYRPVVAGKLEQYFAGKLDLPAEKNNSEQFLEKLLLSYQARAEM